MNKFIFFKCTLNGIIVLYNNINSIVHLYIFLKVPIHFGCWKPY